MNKHLLAIVIATFALVSSASAQRATILDEGQSAPECRGTWNKAEKVEDLTKVFGAKAPPCPEGNTAYKFRCSGNERQWKVRCEPDK